MCLCICFLFRIISLIILIPRITITIPTINSRDKAIFSGIVSLSVKINIPTIKSVVVCPSPHIAPRNVVFLRFLCFDTIDDTATT